MSVDWNETKSILLEIEQLFTRDDDIKDIEDIKKMMNEIDSHRKNHLLDLKELIKRKPTTLSSSE